MTTGATLATILNADLAVPQAIETKFPMLPKLSKQLSTLNSKLPAGPTLPAFAVTALEPPPPNKAGQPLANFFNGTPVSNPLQTSSPFVPQRQRPPLPLQDQNANVNFLARKDKVQSNGQTINYR
jgi:hypothetical protein